MLFAVAAVLAAFVVGRATAPSARAAAAKVIVKTEKSIETVHEACPNVWTAAPDAEPIDDEDDPDAIDADQTTAVRILEDESQRIAALEASLGSQGAIRGVVSDHATGETLAGVTIVAQRSTPGNEFVVITDENGAYEMTVPPDRYTVTFYYADTTVQHTDIVVATHKITPVFSRLELKPQEPYRPRIEPEEGITITDEPLGITFSGETALESEYYE